MKEKTKMKTIAVEEHFQTPNLVKAVKEAQKRSGRPKHAMNYYFQESDKALLASQFRSVLDLGEGRLALMDANGIETQVVQTQIPSWMDKADATPIAHDTNDELAAAISKHPDRFRAFAQIAFQDPEAGAAELNRTVTKLGFKGAVWSGMCGELFLDDPSFRPILGEAERLEVPIYLHPSEPPQEVFKAYYTGLPDTCRGTMACPGWGWHTENGLHAYRLVLNGLFDRFPKLQFILGHLGEHIPWSVNRADEWITPLAPHLERRVGDYFSTNFYYATSGYFYTAPLICALLTVGADRIVFAVDYPYTPMEAGRKFLETAPLSQTDLAKITHLNIERLLKL